MATGPLPGATAGLDGDRILEEISHPQVRERLKTQTERAINNGVFGIPSILYRERLFFGYDDLEYLEMYLLGNDPLDSSTQAKKWVKTNVSPSAERKEVRSNI